MSLHESIINGMSGYYQQRIHRALDSIAAETLQLRVSSLPDRDLAMAIEALDSEDGRRILVLLPPAKAHRVKQEQDYLRRLRFNSSQLITMAERLADGLEGRGRRAGGTWIAPPSGKR